jgi:hypothetical protein
MKRRHSTQEDGVDLQMTDPEERSAARYLLGRMDEAEREAFELRSLEERSLSDTIAAVENDLRDAYLAGSLGTDDRDAFERCLLATPEQRERLEVARAFRTVIAGARLRRPIFSWTSMAIAAALAAVVTTAILFAPRHGDPVEDAIRVARSPRTVAPPPVDVATASAVTDPASAPRNTSPVVILTLSALTTRGSSATPSARLAEGATLRLVIALQPGDDEFASYGLAVQTAAGTAVVARAGVPLSAGPAVELEIPAAELSAGEYEVLVDGFPAAGEPEPLGVWSFSITRT